MLFKRDFTVFSRIGMKGRIGDEVVRKQELQELHFGIQMEGLISSTCSGSGAPGLLGSLHCKEGVESVILESNTKETLVGESRRKMMGS